MLISKALNNMEKLGLKLEDSIGKCIYEYKGNYIVLYDFDGELDFKGIIVYSPDDTQVGQVDWYQLDDLSTVVYALDKDDDIEKRLTMTDPPRMFQAIELSTKHIERDVAVQLNEWSALGNAPGNLTVYPKSGQGDSYGWFIAIHDEIDLDELPRRLAYVIAYCSGKGAEWIIFDCDVEVSSSLPYYVWY